MKEIISISCHTRDFDEIEQFIEHHLNLGFDRVVLYDNLSKIPVKYDDDRVIIIRWEKPVTCKETGQKSTYTHYIENYSNVNGWTAFIDEDEFINTKGINIKDVLKNFSDYDSLGINWKLFGDKVDENNNSSNIVEKYLYHMPIEQVTNNHIKTICRNENVIKFINPHAPILKQGKYNRNIKGDIIPNYFSTADWSKIWIDHYHVRGLENYIYRKSLNSQYNNKEKIIEAYYRHNNFATQKRID